MMKRAPLAMADRNKMANDAMLRSIEARQQAGFDLHSPICIYEMCEKHRILVRFHSIGSMEGFYERGTKPRIHLSSLRPLARRAYTCAHELGHHVYGHGSTIDELREEDAAAKSDDEFLVDAFAGFTLMPTLGLRRAFAARHWKFESASARQMFVVACEFGVGYATLVQHLAYGVRELSWGRAKELLSEKPQGIRAAILGEISPKPLVVVDKFCAAKALDTEIGMSVFLPPDVAVEGAALERVGEHADGVLWRARTPGVARPAAPDGQFAVFIRVAREAYQGLAAYRHFEDDDND